MSNKLCCVCHKNPRKVSRNGKKTFARCEDCQREYWRESKRNNPSPSKKPKKKKAEKANPFRNYPTAKPTNRDMTHDHIVIIDGERAALCQVSSYVPLQKRTTPHIIRFYKHLGYQIVTVDHVPVGDK